jgi:glycosyltransferase involved in cell wall biosynthesis
MNFVAGDNQSLRNAAYLMDVSSESLVHARPWRPLRLLFVTPRYLPYTGGTEIHTYEVARRMVQWGHAVTVLTTDPRRELATREESDGIMIRRVAAWPTERDYYFAPGIYAEIARGEWDIVHCQGYHTFVAPLAMVAALRHKIPYVVTFHSGGHSSRLRNAARPIQQGMLRPLLLRAQRLICVSRFEAEYFRERLQLPAARMVVIPNGSNLPAVMPGQSVEMGGQDGLIVSVGRLERYKGHHKVIAALPEVLARHPTIRLRIAGEGPYEAALRMQVEALGLADHVEIQAIQGRQRDAMASLLLGARVVVLLSDYESQGISMMEALALGRPVIVAKQSALNELVDEGWAEGILPDCTPGELANAILRQLEAPTIPQLVRLPTWDACAGELLNQYQAVAEGKL